MGAEEGDYPFGLRINAQGTYEQVCTCSQVECKRFPICRKDLLSSEPVNTSEPEDEVPAGEERSAPLVKEKAAEQRKKILSEAEPAAKAPEKKKTAQTDVKTKDTVARAEQMSALEKQKSNMDANSWYPITQVDFINQPYNERMLINAGPGTGKTWAMTERFIHLLESGEVEPEEILILCYTRSAVAVAQKRLRQAIESGKIGTEAANIEIRTLDSFATSLLLYLVAENSEYLPADFDLSRRNYDSRISLVVSILRKDDCEVMHNYQCIFVDEMQDIVSVRAELLLALLKALPGTAGANLLGDSCQAIYDYSVQQCEIGSRDLYRKICKTYHQFRTYSFSENHRMSPELQRKLAPLRKAVLQNNTDAVMDISQAIRADLDNELQLDKIDAEYITELTEAGSVAFLTRSNIQALMLSASLNERHIRHTLQLRSQLSNVYASWIGHVFYDYEAQTISEEEFCARFCQVEPELSGRALEFWYALQETQQTFDKNRYDVSELLRGILRCPCSKLFYPDTFMNPEQVVVSNIHRVKGDEFDKVYILDKVLDLDPGEDSPDMEARVLYVGMTRAKNELGILCGLKKNPYYKPRIYPDRHFTYRKPSKSAFKSLGKKNTAGRSKLASIEFGLDNDINFDDFAKSDIQKCFKRNNVAVGSSMILKRQKTDGDSVVYYLMDDDEQVSFGEVPARFVKDYCTLYQVSLKNKDMTSQDYPECFEELYIDNMVTCISANPQGKDGAKIFDDICLWNAFSVKGMARASFVDFH